MRSHYIRMHDRKIFRIDRTLHGDPRAGDRVLVHFYSRSLTVVRLELIAPPETDEGEQEVEAEAIEPAPPPEPAKPKARDTGERPEMPKFG
jgi:hypothetical protein